VFAREILRELRHDVLADDVDGVDSVARLIAIDSSQRLHRLPFGRRNDPVADAGVQFE
jgi:hypothetical protein